MSATSVHPSLVPLVNRVIHGDCIDVMRTMPAKSVDLIVTDPPYIVQYCTRDGRSYPNDDNDRWLAPAFEQAFRVLSDNRVCVCFYGWPTAERFLAAWRAAGFRLIGHLTFVRTYDAARRFVRYRHDLAYILAKGFPKNSSHPIADVLALPYCDKTLHPAQRPVSTLLDLVRAFSVPGHVVLDPFCGSGSVLVAASRLKRPYIGIELDARYYSLTRKRLHQAA